MKSRKNFKSKRTYKKDSRENDIFKIGKGDPENEIHHKGTKRILKTKIQRYFPEIKKRKEKEKKI